MCVIHIQHQRSSWNQSRDYSYITCISNVLLIISFGDILPLLDSARREIARNRADRQRCNKGCTNPASEPLSHEAFQQMPNYEFKNFSL